MRRSPLHSCVCLPALALALLAPLLWLLTGCGSSFAAISAGGAQPSPGERYAPGQLVVVYRDGAVPAGAHALAALAGASSVTDLPRLGLSAVHVSGDESAAIAALLAEPGVAAVLHDRVVSAHRLQAVAAVGTAPIGVGPVPVHIAQGSDPDGPDSFYNSPQGWAVVGSGGYGDDVPGGASAGPWNTSLGAGVRIAVLDSGVDATHPDLAPNLALNLSEVDQSALPSACDDGSPQDQQGHGSFTASLAAAAVGGGQLIGVAPQATLLNIKVLERLPAATGATVTARCEAGEADGLLSWVLAGLEDAIENHASVVSLSLGTLVDTSTGDGAGWQAEFNAATYAATQAGTVVVAALGNDGLDLSTGTLMELPAQARGVLPVVASTNPACAENDAPGAACAAGPVRRASYSNHGVAGAVAAPGGSYPQGSTSYGVTGFVRGACSNGLPGTRDGLPGSDAQPTGESFGCFSVGHAQYVQAMGTSASAPLVAGAAAVLMAAHPGWTAAQVVQALQGSASTLPAIAEPVLDLPAALGLP